MVLASTGGKAVDDFSAPGTETQDAIDLLRAHTPALAGADSTLVFSVENGKISDPQPRAAIEGALAKVKKLDGVAVVADPFAEGGAVSPDGRLAAVDVRYRTDPAEIEKADGEALLAAAEHGGARRRRGRGARHAGRPRAPSRRRRSASSSAWRSRSSCSRCCSARGGRWRRRCSARCSA